MFATVQQFRLDITAIYFATCKERLADGYLQKVIDVFAQIYLEEFPATLPPPSQRTREFNVKVASRDKAYHLFLSAFSKALVRFTEHISPTWLEHPPQDSVFAQARNTYFEIVELDQKTGKEHLKGSAQEAFAALAAPFLEMRAEFDSVGLFDWHKAYPEIYYASPVRDPGEFSDHHRVSWDDATDAVRNSWRRRVEKYHDADQAARDKATQQRYDLLTPLEFAMLRTPLFPHAAALTYIADVSIPFQIPDAARFAGTWIVAPPGRGKTNLLHNMIAADLKSLGTIILMDSKGDLINSYRGYSDVVLIEPTTVAINPLQLGASTRSLEFLEYVFSALLETAMTPLQKTLFRSVLTLLLKVPNATLETFRQILTTGWKPFEPYVLQCDRSTQDFFMAKPAEFDGPTYKETKQQVLWRLRLILSNEYLQQIFTSPVSNVDFFALLDSGQLVIIDNSKDVLGEEGAEFFGRFFVAVIWMAAVSRSKLRPEQKVPVSCYIDEAHTVIKRDDKIATILDECRSQKIALIMAHQRIAQIVSPNVLDALGNCAIRIANSDDDAAALAPRFRTEPQSLRVAVGHFALFVRDATPNAVTVSVPLFDMTAFPPPPPPRFGEPHRGGPQSSAPPNDRAYDDRYDLLWSQNLSPIKARDGTVMTIILPSRRTHLQPIPAGAKNGYRFCVKGQSGILRPDGSFGNLWVELEIADVPGANAADVPRANAKEDF